MSRVVDSAYRMGWMLVMFDLPVLTKKERKVATEFRKKLLDDGYQMVQFSVYARPCVDRDRLEKHALRIENFCPAAGNVRVLFLTDRQWERGLCITGPNYDQGNRTTDLSMPEQIEFW